MNPKTSSLQVNPLVASVKMHILNIFTHKTCVCAHLIQTRYAQRACSEMRISVKKHTLPKCLILFSPWTDMTTSGESYKTKAAIAPILSITI